MATAKYSCLRTILYAMPRKSTLTVISQYNNGPTINAYNLSTMGRFSGIQTESPLLLTPHPRSISSEPIVFTYTLWRIICFKTTIYARRKIAVYIVISLHIIYTKLYHSNIPFPIYTKTSITVFFEHSIKDSTIGPH